MGDYDEPDTIAKMAIPDIVSVLNLPVIPDAVDDPDIVEAGAQLAKLVLFRYRQENITLATDIPVSDAQEYCSHPGTSANGWFVGYYLQ
jgi:hypothetical protein